MSPGHITNASHKLNPSTSTQPTTARTSRTTSNAQAQGMLKSNTTFEHDFANIQGAKSFKGIQRQPRSEPRNPPPTIFAGQGWISPHPLSVASTAWQEAPQSAITLPSHYPGGSNKGKLSYQEWKRLNRASRIRLTPMRHTPLLRIKVAQRNLVDMETPVGLTSTISDGQSLLHTTIEQSIECRQSSQSKTLSTMVQELPTAMSVDIPDPKI